MAHEYFLICPLVYIPSSPGMLFKFHVYIIYEFFFVEC